MERYISFQTSSDMKGPVPESMLSSADWQLVCTDNKKFPCHSILLSAVSKVFESLIDSAGKPKKGALVDVPFRGNSLLARKFLKWVYRRTITQFSTAGLAYEMAELGHYLDSPGGRIQH